MSPYERRGGVTPTEQRGTHAVDRSMATPPTRRGGPAATTGVERRASRARQEQQTRFTALMHHFTVDNLRACFAALDGTKAPGVDGVTKAMYAQHLEANLQELHRKLHQRSYRPKPVRRVEIPKEDGTMRPLGIRCTEDRIVQELTKRLLESIYEPVFLDTSYGFRPGRSCHDALRRVNQEVMSAPVDWILDMDLARFFDTMPHREILAVLAERIADRTFLRLIARMLKAGVQTPVLSGVRHLSRGPCCRNQPRAGDGNGCAAAVRGRYPPTGRCWCWPTGGCGRAGSLGALSLGWHPLLRVNNGASFGSGPHALVLAARGGGRCRQSWRGRGTAFVSQHGGWTVRWSWWGDGYTDPWFLLTTWS